MTNERKKVVQAGKKIYEKGLVAGTWGNISLRLEEDSKKFVITPSGINYDEMEEEDIVVVNLEGEKLEGEKKPSTEVPLHKEIYKARNDVRAIIHTHSTFANVIACTQGEIPPITEELVQIVGDKIKTAEYGFPGSESLGKSAVNALNNKNAVLLANHGAVALGNNMDEALKVAEIVEKSAKIYLMAELFGEPRSLDEETIGKIKKMYKEKYGQD